MENNLILRPYQTGDEEKIVDLLLTIFPEWQKREHPLEYWKWKYLDCPTQSSIRVAEHEGEIIAVNHGKFYTIKIGDSPIKSQYSDDVCVQPKYRNSGVYSNLQAMGRKMRLENGIQFNYSITTNPIIIKHSMKSNLIEFPKKISHLSRVKDVEKHLKAKSTKNTMILSGGHSLLKTYNTMKTSLTKEPKPKTNFTLKKIVNFGSDVNSFCDKVKGQHDFMVERNSKYLNWRHFDKRGGDSTTLMAQEGDEVIGYIVTEIRKDGDYAEGYIMDLLSLPSRIDVANTLLREACKRLDDAGINSIYYKLVRGHQYSNLAKRLGFSDISHFSKMYLNCNFAGLEKEYEVLKSCSPTRIHFNLGDYL